MLIPTNIMADVERVLLDADNYLAVYQILDRLPTEVRDQLIGERGQPGQNAGRRYTAASVVTQAAEMLNESDGYERIYVDGRGLSFEVAGEHITAGNPACAFYRLRRG